MAPLPATARLTGVTGRLPIRRALGRLALIGALCGALPLGALHELHSSARLVDGPARGGVASDHMDAVLARATGPVRANLVRAGLSAHPAHAPHAAAGVLTSTIVFSLPHVTASVIAEHAPGRAAAESDRTTLRGPPVLA